MKTFSYRNTHIMQRGSTCVVVDTFDNRIEIIALSKLAERLQDKAPLSDGWPTCSREWFYKQYFRVLRKLGRIVLKELHDEAKRRSLPKVRINEIAVIRNLTKRKK